MKLQLILLDDLFYRGTEPERPRGTLGPTSYDAVCFASFNYRLKNINFGELIFF